MCHAVLRSTTQARLLVVGALACATLSYAPVAHAASISVTTTTDELNTDGDCSLREALRAANTNAAVDRCAAGSSTPADTITFSVDGTFPITMTGNEDTAELGDFDLLSDITIRGTGATNTIIDGLNRDRVFDIDPLGTCNNSTGCTVTIQDVTIRNGQGNAENFNSGGGVFIGPLATVSISNSVIESSTATGPGGGIDARGPALTLTNVTLQNNDALSSGGGLRSIGNLSISGSRFLKNEAEFGGAISLTQDATKTVSISTSTFQNNTAAPTADGETDDGGAIYADVDATVTLSGNTFAANAAFNNGGALFLRDNVASGTGTYNLTNNTLSGNRADGKGGGIYTASGTTTLNNVTITQNHADNNNAGAETGGGIEVTGGSVTLNNTIVAENFRGSGTTTTDNVKGGVSGANNITSGNPLLGPLASNGGPTATHALLGGSPAINAGNNATCVATDQRGITRSQNGVCDIGAFELSDTTPPDTVIAGSPPSLSNSSSATFSFVGSDNVGGSGVAGFQCQLDGGGFAPCTSPQTYTGLANGDHTFAVRAVDGSGNADPTPATYTWTVDAARPSVTINQAAEQADPTNAGPIIFHVVFSEAVTGFTDADVDLGASTATGTLVVTVAGSGTTYTVSISGMTGNGTVVAAVPADAATDAAGNTNTASSSTDNTVTFVADNTPPTVVSINRADPNPTNAASVNFTATFSEDVSGVSADDFSLATTGVSGASITSVSGSGATRTITINTGSGDGTLRLDLLDDDSIKDVINNPLGGAGTGNGSFTDGEAYTIDKTAPTVTINQAAEQADPTGTSPINFTVTFSDDVTGFTSDDVAVSGTAGATTATVSGSGASYTVSVSGMTDNGTVSVSIGTGAATDAAGNANTASGSTDNTVTYTTNVAPVAKDDSYTTNENKPLPVAAPGVLSNDEDDNDDALTAALVARPANGTLTFNSDGSFTYTPNANFTGTDSFTYKVSDGEADSNVATVTITVKSIWRYRAFVPLFIEP
jgi:CSLREA domain-containing protein